MICMSILGDAGDKKISRLHVLFIAILLAFCSQAGADAASDDLTSFSLDYTYGDPGAEEHRQDTIQQDGRTFRLKLTYRF